jgi:hypothetical protein
MQTRPNRTVTPQYRLALANCVPRAGRYPHDTAPTQASHVSSADDRVKH